MHWLFFDSESAGKLEEAGFSYDSTVGYNGTIGYRPVRRRHSDHLEQSACSNCLCISWIQRSSTLPICHLSPEQAIDAKDGMVKDMDNLEASYG